MVNFHVARYRAGHLVTDRRQIALGYLKGLFIVDFLSGECRGDSCD